MSEPAPPAPEADFDAFLRVDLRVGTVRSARPNEAARVPAYVLEIDFGLLGVRTTSAQLTARYDADDLVGRRVVAAVNLGAKRVAGVRSEVLVLGVSDESGRTVLLAPDAAVPDGGRIH